MKVYDVIIIGAGPAACFSAYEILRRKKCSILMLEASPSLNRTKPCGGQLDKASVNRVPELKKIIVGKTNRVLRYYDDKRLNESKILYYYFNRRKNKICLDYYFPLILRKKGVKILTNHRATHIDNSKKEYAIISCKNKKFFGKIVIDASGAMSSFNHKLVGGKKISELQKYFCSVAQFKLQKDDKNLFFKYIENDKLANRTDFYSSDPLGLYWMIYYDKLGIVNIGNGFIGKNNERIDSKSMLIRFIKDKKLKNWKMDQIMSWVDPFELHKKLYTDHILWIGDAAGMVSAYTGHGMPESSFAAQAIANACVKALSKNDFSEQTLKYYIEQPKMKYLIKNLNTKTNTTKISKKFGSKGPRFLINMISRLTDSAYETDEQRRSQRF